MKTLGNANRDLHLDLTDFVVLDVETTGLSPNNGDRVCEIGAVKMRGGAVIETLGSLIDPKRPISPGAYEVNRISARMLEGAPLFESLAPRLKEMIEGAALVAYNAPFDMSFILNEFRIAGYPSLRNVVVDALTMARQLLPGLGRYPQENVARTVGIAFPVKHRALEDAMVTAQLFTMFTSILKAHDCTTCSDLHRKDLTQVLYAKRMNIVTHALLSRSNLWIKYLSPANGEISDRVVTPKECMDGKSGRAGSSYLIAYCHSAQAERNFRIDRILDLRLIDHRQV